MTLLKCLRPALTLAVVAGLGLALSGCIIISAHKSDATTNTTKVTPPKD